MKIVLESKTYGVIKATMLLLAVGLLTYVAYAAVTQTVSNTGTITAGSKNFALAVPSCATGGGTSGGATPLCEFAAAPSCSATSGTYNPATTTYTISDWNVPQQTGTQTKFICLENTGIASTATTGWAPGSGTPVGLTCTSDDSTAKPIANDAFLAIGLTCTTTLVAQAATGVDFGTFTIS